MKSLNPLRKKIDAIDIKLVELLNQRATAALEIARIKKKRKVDVFSPDREAYILKRLQALTRGPLRSSDIDSLFREILSVCRSLRVVLDIAYLGPQGTFTHLAAMKKFGKRCNYIPCESIGEVFVRVQKEHVNYGVVPIENSIEGAVNYTLDMFLESDLKICSEVSLPVSHSLLRRSERKKLLRIYSHPHVFPQCREWLLREYPAAQLMSTISTAKAAEMAKRDENGGCIGNRTLAVIYGLREVRSSIEDSLSNVTRFLIIGEEDSPHTGHDKTSILFSIKDRVGALYDALYSFRDCGVNLTKIESRPSKRKPWEYYFFVDFHGHREDSNIRKAFEALEKKCVFLKILGSYPKEVQ